MKLLCVLIVFIVVTNNVAATSEAEFYGTWSIVQFFGDPNDTVPDDVASLCVRNTISPSETKCTCNGVELATFNVLQIGEIMSSANITASIADTHEEAIILERSKCRTSCGLEFKVLRKLDDNYFIMYRTVPKDQTPDALLFAKSVPTLTELNAYVNNITDFKDKAKTSFCVNVTTKLLQTN